MTAACQCVSCKRYLVRDRGLDGPQLCAECDDRDGIPLAVKDNIAVANVPTTGGTRAFAKRIAAADATVITRLCAAGGVIIGTLNMHEGALGATTDNPFWGRCDNPAAPGQTTDVRHDTLQSRQVSPTSLMPPGLINAMNPNEVADLLAYILSGGDKRGKMFKR